MEHIIFNREKMEFRYGSDITVYTEMFKNGRLLVSDYHASGMPLQAGDRVDPPVTAFKLEIDGSDAAFGWTFEDFASGVKPDGRPFGELTLHHPLLHLKLRVVTQSGMNGLFTRQLFLTNLDDRPVSLTRVSPLSGVLWELASDVKDYMDDYKAVPFRVGGFKERYWGTEGNFDWLDIPYNAAVDFGSDTGRSGHGHPFAIAHSEFLGGYFLCQMAWSASWRFRFANEFRHTAGSDGNCLRLCFELSPMAPAPMRVIEPGEEVAMPEVHFAFSYKNLDAVIQDLHAYQRKYLLAKPVGGHELISYDGWGYHGSDYREDILFAEVDRAAELGAELYMVDAGWYGRPGTDWFPTVGDWQTSRLANDLYPLIDRVHEKGMKFGLWVEPEAVGNESLLMKEHPDWLMHRCGTNLERCLDLSRPEVEDWVETQLSDIIARYKLDLLRIDYNNQYPNEGGFNQKGRYLENTHWRHVEAIHRIFDRLKEKFPALMLENCASGGGRTDLGMMSRFSKTQISDWYRLPRVARTLNGMSMCLPPETLLLQYGVAIGAQRYGGAEAQIQITMMGCPKISGIAPIEENVNPALTDKLKKYIALYKSFIRPIQETCLVYHHTPVVPGMSGRGWVVMEFDAPDKERGYALLVRLPGTDEPLYAFSPRGLDPSRLYKVTFAESGRVIRADGYRLMSEGIPVRLSSAVLSELLLFEAED